MRTLLFTLCLDAMMFSLASAMPSQSLAVPAVVKAEAYGKLPLSFEANRGQTDPSVRFLSRGSGYSLFLTDTAAVLSLRKGDPPRPPSGLLKMGLKPQPAAVPAASPTKTDIVRMELAGANRGLRVEGADKLPGTANYFIGNDPAKWRSAVPTYAKVRYAGVYPGVDLVYYGNQNRLEYDFIVAPHADPKPIRLHFAGARKLKLDPNGDLEVLARNGQIAFHKPVVYQEIAGKRQPIQGRFSLMAKNTVSFTLGDYNREKAVVIDPVLVYSTYLGGSLGSTPAGIAADSSGSVYVLGTTASLDFPLYGAEQTVNQNAIDMFVSKLNASGDALVYSTFLGGSGITTANGTQAGEAPTNITIDSSGNAFICGGTTSTDFPITPGAFQTVNKTAYSPEVTGFVTKLSANGSSLLYSTYLGGIGSLDAPNPGQFNGDLCSQVVLDSSGNAYVVGITTSPDFPTTAGAYQTVTVVSGSGFVTKLNPSGTAAVYSTLILGTGANAIAIDSAGDAFVGGTAYTPFQTTAGAYQAVDHVPNNGGTGFVVKLNPAGSAAIYATFLGGSGYAASTGPLGDAVVGLSVNATGEVYVTGNTSSNDFPVTAGAVQAINKARSPASTTYAVWSPTNIFVTKINSGGTSLVFSTYLGSSAGDYGGAPVVDASGSIYLAGTTYGIDYPISGNAFQKANNSAGHPLIAGTYYPSYAASENAVLTKLSSTGSLIYSTYYGGSGYFEDLSIPSATFRDYFGDIGAYLALDPSGNAYLAGAADSPDLPISSAAYQSVNPAHLTILEATQYVPPTAFIAKFNFNAGTSNATLTALTSDAPLQNAGTPVTFTPHVQSLYGGAVPTGTVAFIIDGKAAGTRTLDGTGRANLSLSTLSAGTHTVAVNYSGDSLYSGSTSPLFTQTILLVPASITVISGAGQSARVGTSFPKPIVVQVNNINGIPIPNVAIDFVGVGVTFPNPLALTNNLGQASVAATPSLIGVLTGLTGIVHLKTYLYSVFPEYGVGTPSTTPSIFAPVELLPTGASAFGASLQAVADDFNGDGLQDLVLTNTLDATASLLLGKGDGTFQAPSTFAVGNGPYGVAAGDFNGDGKPDVAVVNGLDNTVSVLLNGPTGLPAAPTHTYAVGSQPYGVAVADLNRDGKLDLVVTNNASRTLSVLFGNGDGTFQAAVSYPTGNYPFVTAIADVNNDGYPDLIVENLGDNTVEVLTSYSAGSFFIPTGIYATGKSPFHLTTGDFNGDGYPDLAVANLGENTLSVLLNDKTGKFLTAKTYATGIDPTSVLAQDMNGDGVLDLVTTNLGDATLSVLLGRGDGTFLGQTAYAAGTQPYSLLAADFNSDGRLDLAITSFFDNTVGVLIQTPPPASGTGRMKGLPGRTLKPVVVP